MSFGISRALGRRAAERLVGRRAVEWSDTFFTRFGPYAVLVGRLVPIVSFDAVSYGAGLTRMGFWGFLAATGAGMIPATLVYSYLGHLAGSSASTLVWSLAALTLLGVLVVVLKNVVGTRFGPWSSISGGEPDSRPDRRSARR